MKRSSSPLDQISGRAGDDDPACQAALAKGDQPSAWSPRHSTILGTLSDPSTYVIHFLDTHLTIQHCFQLCSLFGRVRLHGHVLRPHSYYSVYNYRTNSSLPIELIPSTASVTAGDIAALIPDVQLAETAVAQVQKTGGDILLIRREPMDTSPFIKTMREHHHFSKCFAHAHSLLVGDPWRQMEQDLKICLIETTEPTSIVVRDEFVSTVDRIIHRWLTETASDLPFVVMICGEKDMGKSTFTRYLINRALNHTDSTRNLTYFDCDIGQCEFTPGGCLSCVNITAPLLGPPCSHMQANPKPDGLLYYGQVSPQTAAVRYLQYIDRLRRLWNLHRRQGSLRRTMVVVNTMGWGTGLGLDLLKEIICMCSPNMIVQLSDSAAASSDPARMPDVTLEWLLQQSVFYPYRRTIHMSHRRQPDYDGKLKYEYIKLISAAVGQAAHSNQTPKLRPRDHRLLASWSYFFASALRRIRLPRSQVLHLSLIGKRLLPDDLDKSVVGLCSSEHTQQLRSTAVDNNGFHQISDQQDQIFECFGFGWIESFDKQTQTYEVYTPVNPSSDINILVSGAFDTPDEFRYMFPRATVVD